MPDVRDAGFQPKAADEIVQLLELSQGRAFCLFTSYSQMNDLFERVRPRVSFPLLLQGTAPRSVLLERFKNTEAAVPFPRSEKHTSEPQSPFNPVSPLLLQTKNYTYTRLHASPHT